MRSLVFSFVLIVSTTMCAGQEAAPDIAGYLSRVDRGEADQVRTELPALLARYPNDPGVLYLQAVLTTDGTEAVRVYQSIVDNFPKSEWADDALYKVYQFYYAIGLYRTAEIKMNQLLADYPQSKYVTHGAPSVVQGLPEEKDTAVVLHPEETKLTQEDSLQSAIAKPSDDQRSVSPPAPSPASSMRGQFALQVGAYAQQTNAEKQRLFFEDLGYPVEVVNTVRSNRSLFVVLVGEFRTTDEARAKGEEIMVKYNMHPMVVTR